LSFCLLAGLASCLKEDVSVAPKEQAIVDYVDPEVVKTPEDKKKAETILQVTRVLRKIYKDRKVVEEVNAAIATGYYVDESVMLKDLLDPDNSPIYQLPEFNERKLKRGFVAGRFKTAFEQELGIPNSEQLRSEDYYFEENGVGIYFPYHEDTQYSSYPLTIVPATVEADQAYAQHPLCDELNPETYAYCSQSVLVNDDYASSLPTHVVNVTAGSTNSNGSSQACQGSFMIHIGYVRILDYHQYDKLISFNDSGGSEVIISRANSSQVAYPGPKITAFIVGSGKWVEISRRAIRNREWVSVWGSPYHATWNSGVFDQLIGIYEWDNSGSKVFTGTVTFPNWGGSNVQTPYEIQVQSKNAIINNQKYERSTFANLYSLYGQTPPYQTGWAPEWLSQDGHLQFTTVISCY
jgi:hypothetical protein